MPQSGFRRHSVCWLAAADALPALSPAALTTPPLSTASRRRREIDLVIAQSPSAGFVPSRRSSFCCASHPVLCDPLLEYSGPKAITALFCRPLSRMFFTTRTIFTARTVSLVGPALASRRVEDTRQILKKPARTPQEIVKTTVTSRGRRSGRHTPFRDLREAPRWYFASETAGRSRVSRP